MPQHTPSERARNRPARDTQRRRNAQRAKPGDRVEGARRALSLTLNAATMGLSGRAEAAVSRMMSAKQARKIRAPRNSPAMSSFEKLGGISGRHNSDHG